MTASTPRRTPSTNATGMPPPPPAMTVTPCRTSSSIASRPKTLRGSGDATTRRQPASCLRIGQSWDCRTFATSLREYVGPIGLVGSSKAGSSASTSTRVRTVATGPGRTVAIESSSRYPIQPSVCAVSTSIPSGSAPSRPRSSTSARWPTCGPFPWVTTRSPEPATSDAACAATSRRSCWVFWVGRSPFSARAFPPMATTRRMSRAKRPTCRTAREQRPIYPGRTSRTPAAPPHGPAGK